MTDSTAGELRRLGKAIRAERIERDLSQETFAERADIDRTYISRIERGQQNLSWESVSRIARALKVKPSALISRAGL